VTTVGVVKPITMPAAPVIPVHVGQAISLLPDGDLATLTSTGVLEFPGDASSVASATSESVTLQLPVQECGVYAPSAAGGTPVKPLPSRTDLCRPQADAMAADGAGAIWVVPGTEGVSVEQLGL
jgi:hypothetical protein